MNYNVFGGTLNLAQSIHLLKSHVVFVIADKIFCIDEYCVISAARNHSFCSPRWNAPTFSTLYSVSARPGTITLDGSRPLSSRMMTSEVRPTATWPRTPKPQKTMVAGPGSPRSIRRMMRTGDVQPPPPVMKRSM